ncbi:hypothetical protein Droror1_Dr00020107 [Drosera rotundifolia]
MNKTFAPKDERIVSTNPSPDTVIAGPPRDVGEQLTASDAIADVNTMYPINTYAPPEQTYYYGGFDGNTSSWGAYPTYVGSDGLQPVSPVMFGDNPSLGLHPYGFNSQLAYGQYSPASVQPFMMSPTLPVSQNEPTREGQLFVDTSQSSSFYHLPAIFTPGEHSSNQSSHADLGMRTLSPLGSMAAYTQSVGPFASYDPNMGQVSPQWTLPGFGVSNYMSGQYRYGGVQQNIKYANMASSQPGANYRYQLSLEKGRSQREQDSSYAVSDRNRGPRATKVKGKSTSENSAPLSSKIGEATSEINTETYNDPHFPTEYQNAKFFIIKSFSEDNVHRSIKYSVWSSTPNGNRKLDGAFNEAKEKDNCPVFLFFSVNASAQFCGLAEMVGPVDFENSADYWQQDRWNGRFPVCWHFIKDVPNSKFRHILLENNENKPVTHSRDSQEVKLEQGLEMLRIFKDYEENTSILDDFDFYDERERVLKERKSRQFAKSSAEASGAVTDASINEISDRLDQGLRLDEKQGGSGK